MQTYLEELATAYPRLAAAFARIPDGEAHLRRLRDLNAAWQRNLSGGPRAYAEVVVTEERPSLPALDTFDVIYAGGGLNLLNAAVMTRRYGLRVLVIDRFTVGAVHREWNISREELQELLAVGLLTPAELEYVVQREYKAGLVHFHAEQLTVEPSELLLTDVLDVAVDAERLASLCVRKIQEQQPRPGQLPNVVLNDTTFVRCAVQPERGVVADLRDHTGQAHSYGGRLLIDGMGSTSPIACQLNCGRPFSLVCPTVGTVARGYLKGAAPGAIDPDLGEILITTEHAHDGRQLIWEAFPGAGEQVAIYLFHYAEAGARVDLLELFEEFFRLLPSYKDTSNVEVLKPVYGFIPAGYNISLPWEPEAKVLAYDRVLSLGDAAAFQSPLTFCGFGSYVRNVRRITTLLALALETDCLRAEDLSRVRASEAVPAVARAFSKFMIAKPPGSEPASQVNETLNVFCRILAQMGPGTARAFFKDQISWLDYTRLVLRTPRSYPQIYRLALRTLSFTEIVGWITAWLQLGRQSVALAFYRLARPLLRSLPLRLTEAALARRAPRLGLRLAARRESLEQSGRGLGLRWGPGAAIGGWLGGRWPRG